MITKELVKAEVEKVKDDYLEVLYKIIKAFEPPPEIGVSYRKPATRVAGKDEAFDWHAFIAQTYGSLANDPISRGEQGGYEVREAIPASLAELKA